MLFKISGRRKTNFVEKGGRRKKLEGNTRPPPPSKKLAAGLYTPQMRRPMETNRKKRKDVPARYSMGGGGVSVLLKGGGEKGVRKKHMSFFCFLSCFSALEGDGREKRCLGGRESFPDIHSLPATTCPIDSTYPIDPKFVVVEDAEK